MRELLPCPFCGGRAERIEITEDDGFGNRGGAAIECQQCQASSHVEFGRMENLVSVWNTRHTPAATDTGMETWKFHAPLNGTAKMIQRTDGEYVTRSQAEELLAAERMKLEATAKVGLQLSEQIEAPEADNASLIHDLNRIKDHETKLINDNASKDARITELEADNKRLREALVMSEAAISEFYRYQYGGEMRGSYDGKPERDGLWKAMYKARTALGEVKT